jgi:hypothetical protein
MGTANAMGDMSFRSKLLLYKVKQASKQATVTFLTILSTTCFCLTPTGIANKFNGWFEFV